MRSMNSKKNFMFLAVFSIFLLSASQADTASHFFFQPGTPIAVGNFLHPENGCNWLGVVGQVFQEDLPVENIIVKIDGTMGGEQILVYAITGGAPGLGVGGYEIFLSDYLITTHRSLFLELINMSGVPISPKLAIDTYHDCNKNLLVVNFVSINSENNLFLPQIRK
jgi:hypothetical protein